ncbi:CAP domain-containing protein [Haliangium sp.]|uniref:CAP domain-containing protein n=1 Tax=Haliangium sp. TaxID=2663208 RepID=UPI003D0E7B7A
MRSLIESLGSLSLLLVAVASYGCGGAQPPADPAHSSHGINRVAAARGDGANPEAPSSQLGIPVAEGAILEQHLEAKREAEMERPGAKEREHARTGARARTDALVETLPPATRRGLAALEEALVAEINELRRDPAGYRDALTHFGAMYQGDILVVPGYPSVRTKEGKVAVDDALAMLEWAPAAPALTRSPGLTEAARGHAAYLHDTNTLGHGGHDGAAPHDRMDLYGRVQGLYAENIAALYRDAELMILDLLVDDGVETRVHRFNLLGETFTTVGVGCAPHPAHEVVCVIDFAEIYTDESSSVTER